MWEGTNNNCCCFRIAVDWHTYYRSEGIEFIVHFSVASVVYYKRTLYSPSDPLHTTPAVRLFGQLLFLHLPWTQENNESSFPVHCTLFIHVVSLSPTLMSRVGINLRGIRISQPAAHYISILFVPLFTADPQPGPVVVHLHQTFIRRCSSNQAHCRDKLSYSHQHLKHILLNIKRSISCKT